MTMNNTCTTKRQMILTARHGLALLLFLVPVCLAQEPPPEPGEDKAPQLEPPETKELKMSELNQARLVLSELGEQIRIAGAKLAPSTLARKRELGRTKALLEAVNEQLKIVAGDVQRRKERHDQLCEELESLDEDPQAGSTPELIERSRETVQRTEEKLAKLTRYRTRLERRLSSLRREHMRKLLEATVTKDTETPDRATALENMLESEFE